MVYQIKGDYYNGDFFLETRPGSLVGREACDEIIEKYSPANIEQHLWVCPVDYKHIDNVIESAQRGFALWKKTSIEERISGLLRYKEQVILRKDEIAKAISLETGKPFWEAQTEVSSVINKVDITIKDSLPRTERKIFEEILPETKGIWTYRPLGPCLVIGPFNFPCHLANGQILNALISGNSIIFKPSEKTIYSAQLLIECFHASGFPAGVINFINGGSETARRLLSEKAIRGVFFTGSKEVGQKIMEVTHKDFGKLVALEMGGKNTSIIHEDAHLDHALLELLNACFLTSGQRCVATSKIAIHRNLLDEFVSKFHQMAKRIIIDHPIEFDQEPFMGPLIDGKSCENFLVFMGMAKREGAEEIMRGKQLEKKFKGHYVSPSIHLLEKIDPKGHFINSEIFGPSCTIIPYGSIEEAIKIANMGEYGLVSSVFTQQENIFNQCLEEIEVGCINWNRSTAGASARLPFGGVKGSGNHRPAGVTMIDSCVYPVSSLKLESKPKVDLGKVRGLSS